MQWIVSRIRDLSHQLEVSGRDLRVRNPHIGHIGKGEVMVGRRLDKQAPSNTWILVVFFVFFFTLIGHSLTKKSL